MKPHVEALLWMIMEGRPVRVVDFSDAGFRDAVTWLCLRGYARSRIASDGRDRFYLYEITDKGREYAL